MGDEDRSQELPQRVPSAAQAGPRPSAPPVLSEELRQRLQAAVVAEHAAAALQEDQAPAEPSPSTTRPDPEGSDLVSPAGNGISWPRPSAPPVLSGELRQRLQAAVAAESALQDDRAPAEPSLPTTRSGPAGSDLASPAGHGISRPRKSAVKPEPVKPEPVRPDPAANGSASHEDSAVALQAGPSPQQQAREPEKPVRRRLGASRLVVVLVVLVAGALGIAVSLYYVRSPGGISAAAQSQELASRDQAATWVAQQVSHGAIVACDQLMCAALAADGFPSRNLRVLEPTTLNPPVTSAVVVVTSVVRSIFGTSLSTYWAPATLATFGSGSAEISVRVVAPHGAAAYETAASADLAARQESGNALLQVSDVVASATARKQLLAGQVDSRLLLALASLAVDRPIDIVNFGNIAPGEDPDIPLRFADLAVNDQAVGRGSSAYVRSVVADLGEVIMPFRPASTKTVVLPSGQKVLQVLFTAPTPLGLLGS
jgi:hypothetical protein